MSHHRHTRPHTVLHLEVDYYVHSQLAKNILQNISSLIYHIN